MDNEYTVGALCDLIASKKGKKKNTEEIKKNKKVEIPLKSETNLIKLPENVEKSKKRKLKKNSNESVVKKGKKGNDSNILITTQNETVSTELQTNKNDNQVTINSESLKKKDSNKSVVKKKKKAKDSNILITKQNETVSTELQTNENDNQVTINSEPLKKKQKIKKPKNDSIKFKTIEEKNTPSKIQDIKSSADYIEKESRTVFVGNIPVNVKMSAIKTLFKQFGEIETTRLRSVAVKNLDVPKRVSIMKGDFHPQRDTANVYVRFKTVEQAQKALALNATQFQNHTIRVDMALNSGHKQNKKKGIFIGNLPYNIQEDEIWEFFKDCGTICAVRLIRDNMTGVSKGFGYVDFEMKESVEFAIQLDGKRIQNRPIRIKRIDTKSKANKVFNKSPVQFKRTRPVARSNQNFQGETIKPKMNKKRPKPTKTDLMRKKIAKKLNANVIRVKK